MADTLFSYHTDSDQTSLGELVHALANVLMNEDDMEVLPIISQLSTTLSMVPEDSFSSLSIEGLMTSLVSCLSREFPDISLYALISVNNIFDSVANSVNTFASVGGIPPLCSKILNLEYIDLAEQGIKTLERLAYEHSSSILNEGIFSSLVGMMDFFEKSTQSKIVSCAVTIASTVPTEDLLVNHILPVVPVLSSTLQFRGAEGLDTNRLGLKFFSVLGETVLRIAGNDEEKLAKLLESLAEYGMLSNLIDLVSTGNEFKFPCFKLIRRICEHSAQIVSLFHSIGGISVVNSVLASEDPQAELPLYYLEAIRLVDSLLPTNSEDIELIEYYKENSALIDSLRETIFPRILQIYEQSVNKAIRQILLNIVRKILEFSVQVRLTGISPAELACFISEVMNSKNLESIRTAFIIVLILYEKVPEQISYCFLREGVAEKIEELINIENIKELVEPFQALQELIANQSQDLKRFIIKTGVAPDLYLLQEIVKWNKALLDQAPCAEGESRPDAFTTLCEIVTQDLKRLSFEIQSKVKIYSSHEALLPIQEMRNIVKDLQTGHDSLHKLRDLLNTEAGVTLHELSASGLPSTLWSYLTTSKESPKRLQEFFSLFSTSSRTGKSFLEVLTGLLVNLLKYVQHFTIMLYEVTGTGSSITALKTLSGRVRVTFLYNCDEVQAEFGEHHNFFSSIGSFAVSLEAFQIFDLIYQALLKIKSQAALDTFVSAFERNNADNRSINQGQFVMVKQQLKLQQIFLDSSDILMSLEEKGIRGEGHEQIIKEVRAKKEVPREEDDEEIEDEPHIQTTYLDNRKVSALDSRNLIVKLFVGENEVDRYSTVFELNSRGSGDEGLVIKFYFAVQSEESLRPSTFSKDYITEIIKQSSSTPLPETEKVYSPICLLKLIKMFNSSISNFLGSNSIVFNNLNQSVQPINSAAFTSFKLSALLGKQTSDMLAMIGGMAPKWINDLPLHSCHLFNFSQRFEFFRASAFGGGRSLYFYSLSKKNFTVRMLRQKAMVQRSGVLEAGMKILSDPGLLRFGLLEFDFEGEEGTGIGPTLEFYTLISEDLRKLHMWRESSDLYGLFPSPLHGQDVGKVLSTFTFIGRLVAKALYDDRLINLPFNKVFWKLVLNKPLNLLDLEAIDPHLGRYMIELSQIVKQRNSILEEHSDEDVRAKHLKKIEFKGIKIEDLHLSFTLPGYDHIELVFDGKDKYVTLDNLDEYIQKVTEMTMMQICQASAFRAGFEKLIQVESLNVFEPEELEAVICGKGSESWEFEQLAQVVVPTYGYGRNSEVFVNLLKFMSDLKVDERKMFLQFVTGCPRLPIGGFKALNPPLTVVRRVTANTKLSPDQYLPSVMTCQNYLKLPEYSCYEVLKKQLTYAFTEAKETFHLS